MKSLFKEFSYFTRRERRGILMLIILIILVFLLGYILTYLKRDNSLTSEEQLRHAQLIAACDSFLCAIKEEENATQKRHTPKAYPKEKSYYQHSPKPAFQKKSNHQTANPQLLISRTKRDTFPHITKLVAGETIPLNDADTAALKRIPGIGSYIARRIVAYRSQLGGFYSIEQLREIYLDHQQLASWFTIHPDSIRRLNVNQLSVARLQRHPYINFHQARAIVEYRKKHGKLTSLKPLRLLEEFTENDLERLKHYLCFE